MKKRIAALFMSLMFLVGCLLSACQTEQTNEENIHTKSAKELLFEAFDIKTTSSAERKGSRIEGTIESKTDDKVLNAELDFDVFDKNYDGDVIITAGDDEMNLNLCGDNETMYVLFKDFLDSHIVYPLAEEEIDPEFGITEEKPVSITAIEKMLEFTSAFATLINGEKGDMFFVKNDIDWNLPEGGITKAVKVEFILTDEKLTETDGIPEGLSDYDFDISATAYLGESEKLLDLSGNIIINFDIDKETRIEATATINGNDNGISIKGKVTSNGENIAEAKINSAIVDGKETINIEIKNDYSVEGDVLSFSSEIVYGFEYTETEAEKAGNGKIYIKTASLYSDLEDEIRSEYVVPFEYKTEDDGSSTICIKKIDMVDGSLTISLDITADINIKNNENGFDIKANLVSNVESFEFDITLDTTVTEIEKFDFAAPTELAAYDGDIYKEIETRYPEIYGLIMGDMDDFGDIGDMGDMGDMGDIESEDAIVVSPDINTIYHFMDDGTGVLSLECIFNEESEEKATLTLKNSVVELNFSNIEKITSDEAQYKVDMNGNPYYISIIENAEYEDETTIDIYSEEEIEGEPAVIITYHPFYKTCFVIVDFTYETEGDIYTISHFDGTVETKTLLYDEDSFEYYFDGDIKPLERYVYYENDYEYYDFDLTSNVFDYSASGKVESYKDGKAVVVFGENDKYEIEYTTPEYDEEYEVYNLMINGYEVYAYNSPEDEFNEASVTLYGISSCDCFEHTIYNQGIDITFIPETNEFFVNVSLHFTVDGNEYSIIAPDGTVYTKTFVYDSETGEYYIGE